MGDDQLRKAVARHTGLANKLLSQCETQARLMKVHNVTRPGPGSSPPLKALKRFGL